MNTKTARQILLCRRPTGQDDSDPLVKRALVMAAKDKSLGAELESQTAFDLACADDIEAIRLDADSISSNRRRGSRLRGEARKGRTQVGNHAVLRSVSAFCY
jgi:hypothetical protein